MKLGISVLGSGSQGNSILVHSETSGILVDAGFSRKEILARLEILKINPSIIKAILITHEHEDHIKGCRVLSDALDLPAYMTNDTFRYLQQNNKTGSKKAIFDPGTSFMIEDFKIEPFAVQHDAIQPVGFVISLNGTKAGIATDLGHMSRLAKVRLQGCQAIILEANHDIQMLRDAERPLHLKRRILGRHGHLNNQDAIDSFDEIISETTRYLFMAHISSDCNDRNLVRFLAEDKLKKMQRTDILVHVLDQTVPLDTVWVSIQ
ncbi:MAG: hypothetical protein A2020_02205 [Lentisphaerae bacterium GWF2_45_14]|nr:MAG: hypothetical protein A2020_02205 [Lentisphaerae bacterium GWF2_45_14]